MFFLSKICFLKWSFSFLYSSSFGNSIPISLFIIRGNIDFYFSRKFIASLKFFSPLFKIIFKFPLYMNLSSTFLIKVIDFSAYWIKDWGLFLISLINFKTSWGKDEILYFGILLIDIYNLFKDS